VVIKVVCCLLIVRSKHRNFLCRFRTKRNENKLERDPWWKWVRTIRWISSNSYRPPSLGLPASIRVTPSSVANFKDYARSSAKRVILFSSFTWPRNHSPKTGLGTSVTEQGNFEYFNIIFLLLFVIYSLFLRTGRQWMNVLIKLKERRHQCCVIVYDMDTWSRAVPFALERRIAVCVRVSRASISGSDSRPRVYNRWRSMSVLYLDQYQA